MTYGHWSLSRSDLRNIFRAIPSSNDQNGIADPRKTTCKLVSAQIPHQCPPLNSQQPTTTIRYAQECFLDAAYLKVMVGEVFVLKQGHGFPGIGDAVLIIGTWFGHKHQYVTRVRSGQRP